LLGCYFEGFPVQEEGDGSLTNIQLYLAIGLPMVLVLVSYAATIFQISGFREEVRNQLASLRGEGKIETASLREEVRGAREDVRTLREDMREIRSDIKILTGKVYELMGEK
jgi:hypothetical protein